MLGDIYKILAKQMQDLFTEALANVSHPLELGLAREKLLIEYLKRFVPERFGIDTGFIIDSKGNISKQIDIIIYDKVISPIFELPGKLKYFPVEAVVVIGEVKSTISDRKTLHYALENLVSVQRLDRFTDKTNLEVAVHGAHGHHKVTWLENDMVNIPYRIVSFIFTSRAMTNDTMISELKSFCSSNPKEYWPNMMLDFEKYLVSYISNKDGNISLEMFPDESIGLYSTNPEEKDNIVLLFATLLGNFLSVAQVVRPLLLKYFCVEKSNCTYHYFE